MKHVLANKQNFPLLANHPDLVYLDSAATTLKPASVIAKEAEYYEQYGANVARGLYPISEQATAEYEKSREMVAQLINSKKSEEIIFTRGTTESINLLSYSLESYINEGDEIVVTVAEHHSNFLPWQALSKRKKALFKIIETNENGTITIENIKNIITPKTKILAFNFVSNVLGTINPVQEIISEAKQINPNIITVIDAAQAMAHLPVDVQKLDCDFLAFSAHKMFGPTGVGVLYGKYDLLDMMPPFHYGGEMVLEARSDASVFKKPPHKFEAGTPNIAGVIAFQESIKYIQSLGYDNIRAHELELLEYVIEKLKKNFSEEITIFGTKDIPKRSGVIAFSLKNIHPHDIAHILAEDNICIRAGKHCAMPLHDTFHLPATARISVSVYTTKEDIDRFIEKLGNVQKLFEK